jgi:RimJ/RimL family protein N-acetyltransferase
MLDKERLWPADIQKENLRIRRADASTDAVALFIAAHGDDCDALLWRWMHWGPFDGIETFQAWMLRAADDPNGIALTVDIWSESEWLPVGQLRIMEISDSDKRCELGTIWYIPDAQGQGVSRRVTGLLLEHLFETLKFRRIEWKCHHMNVRSAAAAKSYGFTYEGTFRQHMLVKGQNRDTVWFSMLDSEWASIRADCYKGILD